MAEPLHTQPHSTATWLPGFQFILSHERNFCNSMQRRFLATVAIIQPNQSNIFKAGDVCDCGDQAKPPKKGSAPRLLLHTALLRGVGISSLLGLQVACLLDANNAVPQPVSHGIEAKRDRNTSFFKVMQSPVHQLLWWGCKESSTLSLCSLRGLHLLDICLFGGSHFNIQTKQREQVQRDSGHLNNWRGSVVLEDPLSLLSLSLSSLYIFPLFFPALFLEVCPRKQSGTCATTAANPTIPTGWWKKIEKKEEGKEMFHRGKEI